MPLSRLVPLGGLVLLCVSGCRLGPRFAVSEFELDRADWDSLSVSVGFERSGLFVSAPVVPHEAPTITLFDSRFDTLYHGVESKLTVPDRSLGNGEPMLVEVCGRIMGRDVCEQKGFLASPKRITVKHVIDYPQGGDLERGRFSLEFVVERGRWDSEEWEVIDRGDDVTGFLHAYVDGFQEEGVRIPFQRRSGGFNLARLDNYRDFRYYLRSKLLEENEARVYFEVFGGLRGEEVRLAADEKIVKKKAREVRELEAGYFVEQAADRILHRLTSFLGPSRTYVYLDSWQFIEGEHRYTIDIEITWASSFFRQHWHRISGTLQVDEDGRNAAFRRTRSNERGIDRWRDRVDGNVLDLGHLEPRPEGDTSFSFSDAP